MRKSVITTGGAMLEILTGVRVRNRIPTVNLSSANLPGARGGDSLDT